LPTDPPRIFAQYISAALVEWLAAPAAIHKIPCKIPDRHEINPHHNQRFQQRHRASSGGGHLLQRRTVARSAPGIAGLFVRPF
jgi:hypothetical protein